MAVGRKTHGGESPHFSNLLREVIGLADSTQNYADIEIIVQRNSGFVQFAE
jgi:hypothetical protein